MKTAISIPDDLFETAERMARKLGISRSRLYSDAVREFIERESRQDVVAKLNAVYTDDRPDIGLDPILEMLQTKSLGREDW